MHSPHLWRVPSTASDRELVARIRVGDHAAFEAAFRAYYAPLCIFATGYLRNATDAEEVVEDIFVRLWAAHDTLVVRTSLAAYLYGAVRNRSANFARDQATHAALVESHPEELPYAESSDDAAGDLEREELGDALRALLETLPERRRAAVTLRWGDGLSLAEIADVLGVNVQSAANLIARALQDLRERFPRDLR